MSRMKEFALDVEAAWLWVNLYLDFYSIMQYPWWERHTFKDDVYFWQ